LQVAVPADVLVDYRRWLAGRDVLQVDDYRGDGVRRDVVELALFDQALSAGCGRHDIEWVTVDSYPRTLLLLRAGRLDAAATTLWRQDAMDAGIAVSRVTIEDGEFAAALYTAQPETLQAVSESGLSGLRAVSSSHWSRDWAVLQQLPLAALHDVNDWATMVRWVASGKADVLLAPMQPGDRASMQVGDVSLLPVPGMRIVLPGARLYGFAPGSNMAVCFDAGLARMQRQGRVRKAYQQSGFWREDFMQWPAQRQ